MVWTLFKGRREWAHIGRRDAPGELIRQVMSIKKGARGSFYFAIGITREGVK